MYCYHGITQGHLGNFDDLVCQRSGGRPLRRRHDEGGMGARMLMTWMPGLDVVMCPKAPIGAVSGLLSLEGVVLCRYELMRS